MYETPTKKSRFCKLHLDQWLSSKVWWCFAVSSVHGAVETRVMSFSFLREVADWPSVSANTRSKMGTTIVDQDHREMSPVPHHSVTPKAQAHALLL